jgi:lipid-binding SYLF domain-containing protein
MQRLTTLAIALLCLALGGQTARANPQTDQRLDDSRQVFESFTFLTEQSIPGWLLERAYGVVVVPRVIKGALGIGGRGGRGVMAVRNPDGTWSNPVFVTLGGINIGFQIGVQSTDVVLVLMSQMSVEGIAGGKVTLGADASVAAGPMGRSAAAATDATFKAQVLSYSRNEGIFAGVALDGTVISVDNGSNESAYGVPGILPSQILGGPPSMAPPAAQAFMASLNKATSGAAATPAAQPTGQPGRAATPAEPAATAPTTDGATTYPMEDPEPGAPPPP